MIELKIYVPRPGTSLARVIQAGSGVVGGAVSGRDGYPVCVDYQGNLYGTGNIQTWEDKVFHAAGRHVTNYPTIARAWAMANELIEVGVFRCGDNWKNPSYEITDPEALNQWKETK